MQQSQPASWQVDPETTPVHRRAVFSRSVAGLVHRHTQYLDHHEQTRIARRRVHDESLHLIDELVNRPVDPMFEDAQLGKPQHSAFVIWFNRILAFVFCIIVGFAGAIIVQELQLNTREKVRAELADQVVALTDRRSSLQSDIDKDRAEIEKITQGLHSSATKERVTKDNIQTGSVEVTGPGVTVTLTNPVAADNASTDARVTDGQSIRVVSDIDLQVIVSRLWAAKAEAIAINGARLGVNTSIRTAGETILIGTTPVDSPYKIEAIGDKRQLKAAASPQEHDEFYDALEAVGIYPDVSVASSLHLPAIAANDVNYAREDK